MRFPLLSRAEVLGGSFSGLGQVSGGPTCSRADTSCPRSNLSRSLPRFATCSHGRQTLTTAGHAWGRRPYGITVRNAVTGRERVGVSRASAGIASQRDPLTARPRRRQRRVLCRSVEDVTSTALRPFVLHDYAGPPQLSNIRICRVPRGHSRCPDVGRVVPFSCGPARFRTR